MFKKTVGVRDRMLYLPLRKFYVKYAFGTMLSENKKQNIKLAKL